MKRKFNLINIFLFVFFMGYAAQAYEQVENCFDEQIPTIEKIEQMITNEQGVFLLVDGLWFGADALQATRDGILVLKDGTWRSLGDCFNCDSYKTWKCRHCKTYNGEGAKNCSGCKKPR